MQIYSYVARRGCNTETVVNSKWFKGVHKLNYFEPSNGGSITHCGYVGLRLTKQAPSHFANFVYAVTGKKPNRQKYVTFTSTEMEEIKNYMDMF